MKITEKDPPLHIDAHVMKDQASLKKERILGSSNVKKERILGSSNVKKEESVCFFVFFTLVNVKAF